MIWKHSLPALLALAVLGSCGPAPATQLTEIDRALSQRRYTEARDALLVLRKQDANSIETVRRLAKVELELEDGYSAERYLDEWRAITGETPEWVTHRARALILQRRARFARDFLEQAKPAEAEAEQRAWLLVWALMEERKFEKAEQEVMTALARYPQSPNLHARAGRLMAMLGEWEAVNQHVAEALAADPQHYESLMLLGESRLAEGNPEGALEPYRLAAKTYPELAIPQANVVNILIDLGQLEEAQKVLRPALARHPRLPLLRFMSARLDAANKRWAQARATLQAVPAPFKRAVPAVVLLEGDVEAALGNQANAQSLYASIANQPRVARQVAERLNAPPPGAAGLTD